MLLRAGATRTPYAGCVPEVEVLRFHTLNRNAWLVGEQAVREPDGDDGTAVKGVGSVGKLILGLAGAAAMHLRSLLTQREPHLLNRHVRLDRHRSDRFKTMSAVVIE